MKRAFTALVAVACCLAPLWAFGQGGGAAQLTQGSRLYTEHCAACHGADGRAGTGFQTPIWGASTQIAKFANGQGLFEYLQLFMPFDDPSRLSDEEKWAITAFMLQRHGAWSPGEALTPQNAAAATIR